MTTPPKYTILVVDDEFAIRRYLKKRLSTWNYRVVSAENGVEAQSIIEEQYPDLVITDLFMPDGDGFFLLDLVKKKWPELPIVVLSGQGEQRDIIEALRLGAWDYLEKPVDVSSFLQMTIEKVLEKARLYKEHRAYMKRIENDLIAQREALLKKTISQEKANDALKSLLDQREVEKRAIEETMVNNLKRYVFPYLDDLLRQKHSKDVKNYVNIIRTNIEQLISPVSNRLSGAYMDLTPMEIRIADLIRQGGTTKSIADHLNISVSTVEKHRNKIRKKLNILHKKVNLQTYLNALA